MKLRAIGQAPLLREVEEPELASEGILKRWANLNWLHRLGKKATFVDITVGTRVIALVAPTEDKPLAKMVLIIKPETYKHISGTITAISLGDKTITIAPVGNGETVTLKYNENTQFRLRGTPQAEVGQSIRAICNEDMVAKVVFVSLRIPELLAK